MKYKKQRVLITYRENVKLRSQVYKKIQVLISECP